jgi:hypothetical protein
MDEEAFNSAKKKSIEMITKATTAAEIAKALYTQALWWDANK